MLDEVFLGGVLLETSANVMEKKLEAQERVSQSHHHFVLVFAF